MSASKHVEPKAVREHHKAISLAGWHANTTWYVYKSVSKMIPWKHMRVAHTVHELILVFCFDTINLEQVSKTQSQTQRILLAPDKLVDARISGNN